MDNQFSADYDLSSLVEVEAKRYGFKLMVTPRFIEHFTAKPYEEMSSLFVRQNAVGIETFIDVGAHYGFFDVLVGTKNPLAKMIIFEPVPENVDIIRQNLALNQVQNAQIHQKAVADQAGVQSFEISAASDNSGFIANPNAPVLKNIPVDVVCLDQYIDQIPNRPTLVKVDVEGMELKVLSGMRKLIEKIDDLRLLLEFNPECIKNTQTEPENLLKTLNILGFDVYSVMEESHLFKKLDLSQSIDVKSVIGDKRYINLYCIKKDRSVNICFFSHSAGLAGAEWSLIEQTGALTAKYGLPITVVLPSTGPIQQKLTDLGVSTLIIPIRIWCSTEPYSRELINLVFAQDFETLQNEMGRIDSINPDVVVTNTIVFPWGAVAATQLNLPHIWHIREFGQFDPGLNFFLPFPQILEIIESASNQVVVNSMAVKNGLYPNLPEEKWSLATNQISLGDRKNVEVNHPFVHEGSFRFLISGRVTEAKGQGDAVFAVSKCMRAGQNVELCMVGNIHTPYADDLREYVHGEKLTDRIHFVDYVENISALIASTHVVLTCSKIEGFGRGTAEAMLLGKPVIGTNTGGTPELITDGENGLLYTPGNIDELAQKMAFFIDHPERIQDFGKRALSMIQEKLKDCPSDEVLYQVARKYRNAKNPYSPQLLRLIFKWNEKNHATIRSEIRLLNEEIENRDKGIIELRDQLGDQLRGKDEEIASLNHRFGEQEKEITWYINRLAEKDKAIDELSNEVIEANVSRSQLDAILHSRGWKLLEFLYSIRIWMAPHGSKREALLRKTYRMIKPLPKPAETVAPPEVGSEKTIKNEAQLAISVQELSESPIVSIVMPVYNCLELTQQCVRAIFSAPIRNSIEVIVINNASSDGTAQWLDHAAELHKEMVFVNNAENLGFGGAVNQGFNRARGKYITVINNDTIPSAGWIDRLVELMEANPSFGVLSPMTNYVGEGPQIDPDAVDLLPDDVSAYGKLVAERVVNPQTVVDRLVFFCVMIRRDLVDLIGGLADIYKYGNFEDDDFCLRARLAGFTLAIAPNVFVYHYGTQTFKRTNISHDDYMNINREKFYERVANFSTTLRTVQPRISTKVDPKVSVVLRTKDRPGYLVNALTSLSNQTFRDFEVVLVNDGGTDVSHIVRQFSHYFPINYVFHQESTGRTPALNAGLEAACGTWVTYLDDDDIVYPTHLEHLISPMCQSSDIKVSYTDANKVLCFVRDNKDLVIARKPWEQYNNFSHDDFLLENRIPIMTFLHSRSLGIEIGKFDDSLDVLEDWEFLIRLSKAASFVHVPRISCEYRFRINGVLGNSITRNRSNALQTMLKIFSKYPVDQLLEEKRSCILTAHENQIRTLEKISQMDIDDIQKNWLIISEITGFSTPDLHQIAFRA